jgi:hypothetical protein
MTFTTCERVLRPVMLAGEFSSLLGRKRGLPHADCWPRQRHARAGPPRRQRCAHDRASACLTVHGGTRRPGEGDDAAARHGRARIRTRRRAHHAPPSGRRDAGRDRPTTRLPVREQRLNVKLVPGGGARPWPMARRPALLPPTTWAGGAKFVRHAAGARWCQPPADHAHAARRSPRPTADHAVAERTAPLRSQPICARPCAPPARVAIALRLGSAVPRK